MRKLTSLFRNLRRKKKDRNDCKQKEDSSLSSFDIASVMLCSKRSSRKDVQEAEVDEAATSLLGQVNFVHEDNILVPLNDLIDFEETREPESGVPGIMLQERDHTDREEPGCNQPPTSDEMSLVTYDTSTICDGTGSSLSYSSETETNTAFRDCSMEKVSEHLNDICPSSEDSVSSVPSVPSAPNYKFLYKSADGLEDEGRVLEPFIEYSMDESEMNFDNILPYGENGFPLNTWADEALPSPDLSQEENGNFTQAEIENDAYGEIDNFTKEKVDKFTQDEIDNFTEDEIDNFSKEEIGNSTQEETSDFAQGQMGNFTHEETDNLPKKEINKFKQDEIFAKVDIDCIAQDYYFTKEVSPAENQGQEKEETVLTTKEISPQSKTKTVAGTEEKAQNVKEKYVSPPEEQGQHEQEMIPTTNEEPRLIKATSFFCGEESSSGPIWKLINLYESSHQGERTLLQCAETRSPGADEEVNACGDISSPQQHHHGDFQFSQPVVQNRTNGTEATRTHPSMEENDHIGVSGGEICWPQLGNGLTVAGRKDAGIIQNKGHLSLIESPVYLSPISCLDAEHTAETTQPSSPMYSSPLHVQDTGYTSGMPDDEIDDIDAKRSSTVRSEEYRREPDDDGYDSLLDASDSEEEVPIANGNDHLTQVASNTVDPDSTEDETGSKDPEKNEDDSSTTSDRSQNLSEHMQRLVHVLRAKRVRRIQFGCGSEDTDPHEKPSPLGFVEYAEPPRSQSDRGWRSLSSTMLPDCRLKSLSERTRTLLSLPGDELILTPLDSAPSDELNQRSEDIDDCEDERENKDENAREAAEVCQSEASRRHLGAVSMPENMTSSMLGMDGAVAKREMHAMVEAQDQDGPRERLLYFRSMLEIPLRISSTKTEALDAPADGQESGPADGDLERQNCETRTASASGCLLNIRSISRIPLKTSSMEAEDFNRIEPNFADDDDYNDTKVQSNEVDDKNAVKGMKTSDSDRLQTNCAEIQEEPNINDEPVFQSSMGQRDTPLSCNRSGFANSCRQCREESTSNDPPLSMRQMIGFGEGEELEAEIILEDGCTSTFLNSCSLDFLEEFARIVGKIA